MGPRTSLPHSQEPFAYPYPEPDRLLPIPLLKDSFSTNIFYALLLAPYVLNTLPISLFLILLRE